jgi:hypothetical protein
MKNFVARKTVIAMLLCAFLSVTAFAADIAEVIKNARDSYYTLKSQGLKTFKCDVQPDWQKLLVSVDKKNIALDDARLKQLAGLHFTVAIDEQGQSTITPYKVNGDPIDPSVNQLVSGFQQMLSGFYQTWTSMVLSNPFPDASGQTLRLEGDNFRLIGKDGDSDIEILLNKNYAITEMKVMSAVSKTIMLPQFDKTAKGLLFTGVDSDITDADGHTKVLLGVQYQEVQGLQLPKTAQFTVTLPSQVIAVEMKFSNYQVVKQ